jgi:Zn-finger nucleic acid-binding protein
MSDGEGTAPFREAPRMLACPRDGSILETVMAGVQVCIGCDGVWLPKLTLDKAFGTPYWPQGPSAWWRPALACPVCVIDGRGAQMTPVSSQGVFVDRCMEHGVWLDAGELGRLLDAPRVIELEAFYEVLRPDSELPPRLVEFRKLRDEERARRIRELEEFRKRQEGEAAKRRAEAASAHQAELARIRAEEARTRRELLQKQVVELGKQRQEAFDHLHARERALQDARAKVQAAEAELVELRNKVLVGQRSVELVQARWRELEQEIDALQNEIDRSQS